MNNTELETLIQEKLKTPTVCPSSVIGSNLTSGYVSTGFLTGFRQTLIEPVPETSNMARLVAETRAKMKLEKSAPSYVVPDLFNTFSAFGTVNTQSQPTSDLIVDSSAGRIKIEVKAVATTAPTVPADKPKPAPAATTAAGTNRTTIAERAPGAKLHSLAKLLLTAEAYRRYVEPHLADIYLEYNEALAAGDPKAAKRVVLRGYLEVLKPFAYGLVRSLFRLWLQTQK